MEEQLRRQLGVQQEWRFREAVNRMVMTELETQPHLVSQIALQVACSADWLPDPRTAYSMVCCSSTCEQWMAPRVRRQRQLLQQQLFEYMHQRILAQRRQPPRP